MKTLMTRFKRYISATKSLQDEKFNDLKDAYWRNIFRRSDEVMRKSSYLNISEAKDGGVYGLLLNCRHANLEQLKEMGASQNRIENYLKQNLIERVQGQDYDLYRLTAKGYSQFDRIIGSDNKRYHSQSPKHDERLAERYVKVMKENPNAIWLNEEDLKGYKRDMMQTLREVRDYNRLEQIERMSVTDCVYYTEGHSIAFDVVTDNYSNMDIVLKEEFSEIVGCEFQLDKI